MSLAVLETLLRTSDDYEGGQPSEKLIDAARSWLNAAQTEAVLVPDTANALQHLSPVGASFVATLLGNVAEVHRGAERSFDQLWALFFAWCSECNASEPVDESRRPMLVEALTGVGPALVSHLAQLPDRRSALRADSTVMGLLGDLADEIAGVCWVFQALRMSSGSLVALHPTSANGWRLRYENVADCFHLFTLLQCALGDRVPGGRNPNAALTAAATGLGPAEGLHDQSWWHYGHAFGATPELGTSIWGEALAAEIPSARGEQVILLWPPILHGRSWDAGFFTPHLQQMPSQVVLEGQLPPEQCKEWMEHLGLHASAAAAKTQQVHQLMPNGHRVVERPWWKFWS
ncbi:hypothetical protein ACG02S_02220 [Roseateles sp. DC23W]|uniref:Uncharacterized protein n=1 Tax=Pelomonas dachongensis TaxID=3299029 RepID=A0ABW7EGW8_9BURK